MITPTLLGLPIVESDDLPRVEGMIMLGSLDSYRRLVPIREWMGDAPWAHGVMVALNARMAVAVGLWYHARRNRGRAR